MRTALNVACGAYHTLVLDQSGTVYSCGWGEFGQLGYRPQTRTSSSQLPQRTPTAHELALGAARQVTCPTPASKKSNFQPRPPSLLLDTHTVSPDWPTPERLLGAPVSRASWDWDVTRTCSRRAR